jgi:tRNA 2-thiocytidine biosynthesis protein TtcA
MSGELPEEISGSENPDTGFAGSKRLLSHVRRAVEDYDMIKDGDKILVGLSGGKDSAALLAALVELKKFLPVNFDICAATVDMGFEGADFSPAADFCRSCGVEYRVIPTKIAKIVFDVRKESNPCSLCARMRRGALHSAAQQMGANKVALGHHFDDVVDTFMLALIHEGRIGTLSPVTYLDRRDITLIRPLCYIEEKEIKTFAGRNPSLPLFPNLCPEDGRTEREEAGKLLDSLEKKEKGVKRRIFGAIKKAGLDGWRETKTETQ